MMVMTGREDLRFGNAWTKMSIAIHLEIFSEKIILWI